MLDDTKPSSIVYLSGRQLAIINEDRLILKENDIVTRMPYGSDNYFII